LFEKTPETVADFEHSLRVCGQARERLQALEPFVRLFIHGLRAPTSAKREDLFGLTNRVFFPFFVVKVVDFLFKLLDFRLGELDILFQLPLLIGLLVQFV
jgi:hypothetical protein